MHFTLPEAIAVLQRTPAVLRSLLEGLPDGWVTTDEGHDTWSAYDVVGHLIHGERTDWIARAKIILAQGENRSFEPFDRFAQFRDSEGKSIAQLLEEFEALRGNNLRVLRSWELTEQQLELRGEHPAFGSVTLRQLLSTWVTHDLSHIAQIARVMAKQYRDAIGPWRAYIPLLDR